MTYAFKYIKDHKIALTEDYRYEARNRTCRRKDDLENRVAIKGHTEIKPANVNALNKEIKSHPVSVGVEVRRDFQMYKKGVYTNSSSSCGNRLNHGVVVVGVDSQDGYDYYNVKNSWGESWGLKGYIKMEIGKGGGTCGIAAELTVPVL